MSYTYIYMNYNIDITINYFRCRTVIDIQNACDHFQSVILRVMISRFPILNLLYSYAVALLLEILRVSPISQTVVTSIMAVFVGPTTLQKIKRSLSKVVVEGEDPGRLFPLPVLVRRDGKAGIQIVRSKLFCEQRE